MPATLEFGSIFMQPCGGERSRGKSSHFGTAISGIGARGWNNAGGMLLIMPIHGPVGVLWSRLLCWCVSGGGGGGGGGGGEGGGGVVRGRGGGGLDLCWGRGGGGVRYMCDGGDWVG